jgi:hypothetical protein
VNLFAATHRSAVAHWRDFVEAPVDNPVKYKLGLPLGKVSGDSVISQKPKVR